MKKLLWAKSRFIRWSLLLLMKAFASLNQLVLGFPTCSLYASNEVFNDSPWTPIQLLFPSLLQLQLRAPSSFSLCFPRPYSPTTAQGAVEGASSPHVWHYGGEVSAHSTAECNTSVGRLFTRDSKAYLWWEGRSYAMQYSTEQQEEGGSIYVQHSSGRYSHMPHGPGGTWPILMHPTWLWAPGSLQVRQPWINL